MRNPKPVHVERSFRFLRDGGERIDETLPLRSTPADYGCVIKTCPTGVVRTCNETIREWRSVKRIITNAILYLQSREKEESCYNLSL